MTAPTQTYPALELTAAPANPVATGTLYTAATLIDLQDPARLEGGVNIEQINTGTGHGVWPLDYPTPEGTEDKTGDRGGFLNFEGFAVWSVDHCSLVGTSVEDSRQRATQRLRLTEQVDVGAEFADTLLDEADTTLTGGVEDLMGQIESTLADTGVSGVIHADRALYPRLQDFIVRGSGGRLETPMGNQWAFGPGYAGLGGTIVATGPVTIFRTPVTTYSGMSTGQNERTMLAERIVVPTFETVAVAATLAGGGDAG